MPCTSLFYISFIYQIMYIYIEYYTCYTMLNIICQFDAMNFTTSVISILKSIWLISYIYFICFLSILYVLYYIYIYMDLIGLLFICRNSNSFWVASCCSPPLLHQASLNSSGGSWLSRLCAAMASENLLPRLASTPP